MKWSVKRAALTGGIVWASAIFLTTLLALSFNYGRAFLDGIASIYPGYSISPMGSVIGFVYGFCDMFVGVYIVVWVYKIVGK